MAVSSVTSGVSSNTQTVRPQATQSDQAQQAKKAADDQAKAEAAQAQAKPQAEAPKKPVVNTQGQTTGKVVNVTA